jgi:hypothetical protein
LQAGVLNPESLRKIRGAGIPLHGTRGIRIRREGRRLFQASCQFRVSLVDDNHQARKREHRRQRESNTFEQSKSAGHDDFL